MNAMIRRIIAVCLLTTSWVAGAAELSTQTIKAWNQYVEAAAGRMKSRLNAGGKFMWVDEQQDRRSRVGEGKILVEPMQGHGWKAVPNGLIHDWIGAEFIAGARMKELLAVVADYDRYKEIYSPAVVDSHVLMRAGDEDRFAMSLLHKSPLLTTAVDTEYDVKTFPIDDDHVYAISQSTSVREIRNYGEANQHELPPGEGDGFIWRLYSISRYEQRDNGVYVELEVIALTRDIPVSLRWLVRPIVASMSANSLVVSLTQTRDAVCAGRRPESEPSVVATTSEHAGARSGFAKQ